MHILVWCALAALVLMPDLVDARQLHKVNCLKRQTIADALKRADPGDIIRLTGTCEERVVIQVDGITLDGQGTAVIEGGGGPTTVADGGVVVVDGARRVSLVGLTIRNGASHGINGKNGASLSLTGVIVQDNASIGVVLANNTSAEITDSTAAAPSASTCSTRRRRSSEAPSPSAPVSGTASKSPVAGPWKSAAVPSKRPTMGEAGSTSPTGGP